MRIASVAPLTYSPGGLEYFQFIRGGVGADYHQGPSFYQFPNGVNGGAKPRREAGRGKSAAPHRILRG
jgi:hypothetical protein